MSWRTLAALAALLGCSVPNPDHCAVLQGDATCKQRDAMRPFCSKCVGENDGCVLEAVDAACAPDVSATTTNASTTAAPTTGTGEPTGTSLPMETTGTTTTPGTSTGPGTSGPDTTGTSGPGTTTGTTDMTSGTGSSGGGPMCGDGELQGMEACDTDQFGGKMCLDFGPQYGGGTLKCNANCTIDTSMCCLAAGQDCLLQNPEVCCTGKCNLLKCD